MRVKRIFFPCDTWLYLKIYCGNVFSNQLLSDVLFPILEQSRAKYGCNKWFFVRYEDPEPHIRLRFETKQYPLLLRAVTECLAPYKEHGVIWNMDVSTYRRELERYLPENIELCESIFSNESKMLVRLLRLNLEIKDYMVVALSLVGFVIDTLVVNSTQRIPFLTQGYQAFKKEFKITKSELRELNSKYRTISIELLDFDLMEFARDNSFINQFIIKLKSISKDLIKKEYVAPSIIHMLVNRFFHSDNRIMECLIYHHLEKCYKTKNALSKQQVVE